MTFKAGDRVRVLTHGPQNVTWDGVVIDHDGVLIAHEIDGTRLCVHNPDDPDMRGTDHVWESLP